MEWPGYPLIVRPPYFFGMEPCPNCGASFATPFCHACGQKRVKPGIRLGEVVGDFVSGLFNVDAPLPRTLYTFFKGPGRLTRLFVAGRRKAFTPPVRYFLMGVGFYYLMRFILGWDPVDAAMHLSGQQELPDTPALRVNHWMSRNVNLLLPIMMIMLTSADRLFFLRTELSWSERLVHYLFATGTYLICSTLLIPLYTHWPGLQLLGFLVIFGILIGAAISLHRRTVWNILKAVVMVPATFLLYVLLCTVLVALFLGLPIEEVLVRGPR